MESRPDPTRMPSPTQSRNRFDALLVSHSRVLRRSRLEILQLNLGKKCNQACHHCHVDAGPWRTESMTEDVAQRAAEWIVNHRPSVVDLTGGAPELCGSFRFLVETAREAGCRVMDRCNLTIIETQGFAWLPEFLARNEVEVVASLPCYLGENVDAQRGDGVFEKSIRALRKLNALGYGDTLPLSLVYNPLGARLPPEQAGLEADYRKELLERHSVRFSRLFTLTNQPIARFAEDLQARGELESYLNLLEASFNPTTVDGLMCRNTLSVDWRGQVYDCDFNQMLGLALGGGARKSLWDLAPGDLEERPIRTGTHCLACTAGCGSSCTGAIEAKG